jgi:hypothetical protein
METLLLGIYIGVAATIVVDIWALFVKHVLKLPTANWAMVGRWFGHMPGGVFVHRHVADSAPVAGERIIGWSMHYLIGAGYGVAYLAIMTVLLEVSPTLDSALIFGLATIVAPWLIMQPGMGAGIFASRTPRPAATRLVNLSIHIIFGASLYGAWLIRDLI